MAPKVFNYFDLDGFQMIELFQNRLERIAQKDSNTVKKFRVYEMAPIDPIQILDAFTPLLTENGGIKPADQTQFEKIYNIMKNCSTKLVSKCIYYQILMSTSPDVLEQFLKIGGWDLICLWVKSSRDIGNVPFLLQLLKLLQILPMNIDRLRENECPKIVKKLCKHENEDISVKANQIIRKWTKIIHAFSDTKSNGNNCNNNSNNGSMVKEKKRKTSESSSTDNEKSSSSNKKTKLNLIANQSGDSLNDNYTKNETNSNNNDQSTMVNVNKDSNVDLYETYSRDDMNKFLVSPKSDPTTTPEKKVTKSRPVTAKVKQGKFRLDLSNPTTTTASTKSNEKKTKSTAIDSAKKLLNKNATSGGDLKSLNAAMNKTPLTRNILKDSMSFMDALSMMPVVGIKKRRKLSSSTTTASQQQQNKETDNIKFNENNNANNKSMMIVNMNNSNNDNDKDLNNKSTNVPGTMDNANPSSSSTSASKESLVNDITNMSDNKDLMANVNDNNSNQIKPSSPSPPRFSFYKDILDDEKSCSSSMKESEEQQQNLESSDRDSKDSDKDDSKKLTTDNDEQIRSSDGDDKNDDSVDKKNSTNSPETSVNLQKYDNLFTNQQSYRLKPILCYVKKQNKKSVRWPEDDSKLELVKYFELDETERINVTRPSADMKRFDMKHEAQMMNEARGKGRTTTYAPWILIPIDVDPINTPVERGKDSKEKIIQTERMKTTLECFYFHNQLPDNPDEMDSCFELLNTSDENKTRIIPLEDENSMVVDHGVPVMDYGQMPMTTNEPTGNFQPNLPYMNDPMANQFNQPQPTGPPIPVPMAVDSFNPMPPPPSNNMPPLPFQNNNYNNPMGVPPPPGPFDPSNSSGTNFGPPCGPPPLSFSGTQGPNNPNVPYQDYNNGNNFSQPSFNNNNDPNQNPDNNYNNNQQPPPMNFYNNQGPPPPPLGPSNVNHQPDNDNYTMFWSNANNTNTNNTPPTLTTNNNNNVNNYPPGGGPPLPNYQSYPPGPPPPPHLGPLPGPRGFRPRGPRGPGGGGGGFYPRNGGDNNICRFFFRTGKCKFENRCNFSHVMDTNQKPPIRF